jgi:prepilin-type N-terminal cleavage/methylation domain-containing protein
MKGQTSKERRAKRCNQRGFTLVELMVAMVVLLVGVVAVAELVPAAVFMNGANRADSSSLVFAQRELDQFVEQPLTVTSFVDLQGNTCNLGSATSFNTVVGNPVTTVAGHAAIDFSGSQVSGYGYYYTDPEDTSGAIYDARWAVISNGTAGNVTSRRFILGVRKKSGNTPLLPVTIETMVEK